jgi:hypothetical protein
MFVYLCVFLSHFLSFGAKDMHLSFGAKDMHEACFPYICIWGVGLWGGERETYTPGQGNGGC